MKSEKALKKLRSSVLSDSLLLFSLYFSYTSVLPRIYSGKKSENCRCAEIISKKKTMKDEEEREKNRNKQECKPVVFPVLLFRTRFLCISVYLLLSPASVFSSFLLICFYLVFTGFKKIKT